MNKKIFYTEWAFVFGLLLIVLGVTFSVKADFGVSMIVAPSFVLYKFIGEIWPAFTMGMSEYIVQMILLILMIILIRRFKIGQLCCFVTAVAYGAVLDGSMLLFNYLLPFDTVYLRLIYYVVGIVITAAGVSLMFHTYLPPQSYDYFVREVAPRFNKPINKFKLRYDASFLVIALVLNVIFFRSLDISEWWGTIVCTLVNGRLIAMFSKIYEKHFEFKDGLKLRKYF